MVHERAEQRDARRHELQVRAHVGEESGADRGDTTVGVGGQLDPLDHPAAVGGRERRLRAFLDPAHRTLQPQRDRQRERFLRVHIELGAEAAADRRSDHADPVLGDPQDDGELDLQDVGDLRGRVHRHVAAVRLGDRAHSPGLHRHRDQALLHVAFVHRVDRVGERPRDGVGVGLERPDIARVGPELGMRERLVACDVFQIDDCRQLLVVDDHCLHRVARRSGRLGDDDRDTFPGEVHLVDRQRPVRGILHVIRDRPCARQRRLPGITQVGPGQHGDDAGERARCVGVDRADARMRERAAHHLEVQRAGDGEVLDEPGFAGEQHRVLPAEDAAPHDGHQPAPPAASTALTMFW